MENGLFIMTEGNGMYEIIDEYCWEKHKKVLTYDKHQIKGLKNFAHWNLSRAIVPTPLHHHSDIVEIHCLIKGKRLTQVNDREHTIVGGELFITYPYEAHSTGSLPQSPCEFYAFQIDFKFRDELLGLNREYSYALHGILTGLKDRHLKFSPNDGYLLKQAFSFICKGTQEDNRTGVQYLCCFLFNLANLKPVNQEDNHTIDVNMQKVLDYIEEHYKETMQLKDLAAISGYSLSRFKIKFKECVGTTPAEFMSLRKIEYAKKQLEITDVTITELAFEVGFSSSNYFCSVFKKLCNMGPGEYRSYCRANRQMSP